MCGAANFYFFTVEIVGLEKINVRPSIKGVCVVYYGLKYCL